MRRICSALACLALLAACSSSGSSSGSAPVQPGDAGARRAEATDGTAQPPATGPGTTTPPTTAPTPPAGGPPQIGANYNGDICNIDNALIRATGVRWVRSYVNLARNYLTFDTSAQPPVATGVNTSNLAEAADGDSGDSDIIANDTVTRLLQLESVGAPGQPIRTILSIKLDFLYLGQDVPDPADPADATAVAAWNQALESLLTTNDLGDAVDILVIGNEPMFETVPSPTERSPQNEANAAAFGRFLTTMVTNANAWKRAHGFDYQVFVGALNKPSQDTGNVILPQVVQVATQNDANGLVQGLDLHLHESSVDLARQDLTYVRSTLQVEQELIATEFSLVGLWNAHADDPLGAWGEANGFGASTTLAAWLDQLLADAAAGRPVAPATLAGYFDSVAVTNPGGWYPTGWFGQLVEEFAAGGVSVATYGLAAPLSPPGSKPSCASQQPLPTTPPTTGSGTAPARTEELWVLNFVYNGALLGWATDGSPFYQRNPLVAPDFAAAVAAGNAGR